MSIVVSSDESHSAIRVSGGAPGSGSRRHAPSLAAARPARDPRGHLPIARLEALGGEQVGHELAELDGLAVRHEVRLAGLAALGAQDESLDHVVHVRGRGVVAAAADPGEALLADRLGEAGQHGRVAGAPDEPRPNDHRFEPVRSLTHQLLRLALVLE